MIGGINPQYASVKHFVRNLARPVQRFPQTFACEEFGVVSVVTKRYPFCPSIGSQVEGSSRTSIGT